MTGLSIKGKKLWRIPQQGKFKGVCAGIAQYLDIPVRLVRIIVVLSLFFGLFMFTIVAYFILSWILDPMPYGAEGEEQAPTAHQLLNDLSNELQAGEGRLREVERYVTSETFSVRSRFSQL
ncbi:envelope stress response membrane protein PspC [Erwiniaceae bacterium BAC15a-03b]|uniref:Envelope stress response membrane protein PspC n=1 Tax=Winslowiella arboricola TaxID=2978220 RepID=A0A9J6PS22_9GAMM|nr:envelope stress response membrane protein PspC [Winslowiella arboricola]MCU5775640.1 envelope stress response membrane protein PspC [Winslowiella arboricola]MCU5779510.1 envelope stress response membrane protein PspC [Winslowiella arboricola]